MYDDPSAPPRSARAQQGQRCPACGQIEPDAFARFCGGCGGPLAGAAVAPASAGPTYAPPPATQDAHARRVPAAPPMAGFPPTAVGPAAPGQPIDYTVSSVGFSGPAQYGAVIAAFFMLVPSLLFASLGSWVVHAGRDLMDSWQHASVKLPVLGFVSADLPLNFIDLMRLRPIYDQFIYWDDRLWLVFALMFLVPWLIWIVAGAIFGLLFGAAYNLVGSTGGGFKVRLRPADVARSGAAAPPMGWAPGPPPRPPGGWPNERAR